MANLYDLIDEIVNFEYDIDEETGEITNLEELEKLELDKNAKIENLCLWVKNLEADAKIYKDEADSFTKKHKQAKAKAESLRKFIQNVLNGDKFKTDRVTISYRKSETLEVDDPTNIPFNYWVAQDPKLDKVGLKKAIKAGETFDGVRIEEHMNMLIK